MKELMNNPYAWAFLSLISISSLLFAIYTWIAGRKVKEISIDYSINKIVKRGKTPISKLEMKFDGKPIQDLTASIFYIWNSGNEVIDASDIVPLKLLHIGCKSDNILATEIIRQSDESNNFLIQRITSADIEISFEYMDRGEGVMLQVLHTGSEDELFFDCKIKGGRHIRDCSKLRKDEGLRGFGRMCINELLPILFCGVGLYIPFAVLETIDISYKTNQIFIGIICIVFMVLLMFLYLKGQKKIKKIFHRDIPDLLKK